MFLSSIDVFVNLACYTMQWKYIGLVNNMDNKNQRKSHNSGKYIGATQHNHFCKNDICLLNKEVQHYNIAIAEDQQLQIVYFYK